MRDCLTSVLSEYEKEDTVRIVPRVKSRSYHTIIPKVTGKELHPCQSELFGTVRVLLSLGGNRFQ